MNVIINICKNNLQYIFKFLDYLHSLANYDFPDFGKKSPKSNESNQVSQRYESRSDESPHEEQTMYVIEFESEPRERGMDNGNKDGDHDLGN